MSHKMVRMYCTKDMPAREAVIAREYLKCTDGNAGYWNVNNGQDDDCRAAILSDWLIANGGDDGHEVWIKLDD